jgi:acyl-CoA thioester hydrolase
MIATPSSSVSSGDSSKGFTAQAAPYVFETTVYIPDTDCYGIVWHGTYLRWMDYARNQLLEQAGLFSTPTDADESIEGLLFPVVHLALDYKHPAKLADPLTIETHVEIRRARLVFHQQIFKCLPHAPEASKVRCVSAEVHCVVTDSNLALLRRWPDRLQALATFKA